MSNSLTYPPNNLKAKKFFRERAEELLESLIEHRHGELTVRVVVVDGKIKQVDFSPMEKHRLETL